MADEKALTHGATFTRAYHGVSHTLTVRALKGAAPVFTVDGKKTEYPSLRAAAFAVIGPEAAEAWKSLDGKQFWHVRTYVKASDATVASPKVAAKTKAVAKKTPATRAAKPAAKAAPAPKAPVGKAAAQKRLAKAA